MQTLRGLRMMMMMMFFYTQSFGRHNNRNNNKYNRASRVQRAYLFSKRRRRFQIRADERGRSYFDRSFIRF